MYWAVKLMKFHDKQHSINLAIDKNEKAYGIYRPTIIVSWKAIGAQRQIYSSQFVFEVVY